MRSPLASLTVTSPFGIRIHPVTKVKSFHNGVDLRAPLGTEVCAPFAGRFTVTKSKAGGNQAFVTHSGGLVAGFAHLSGYASGLKDGDEVAEGQVIAYTGQSGVGTGPHLHFSLSVRDTSGSRQFFDPLVIDWRIPVREK